MIRTWKPESDAPHPAEEPGYKAVKAWFQQCRDKAAAVEAQRQKIDRIRSIAEKITPSMTGMPGGSGSGDKIGAGASDLVDEERTLQRMETELCNLRIEAARRAYLLISPRQSDYICRFYIDGKSLKTIADEEGVLNHSSIAGSIRLGCAYLAEMLDDWKIDSNAQKTG